MNEIFKYLKRNLLILLFIGINFGYSQVDVNESYRHDIMGDIGNSDNLIYTFNAIPKEYKKQDLTLYNPYAKKIKTVFLESKRGLDLIDCLSLGDNTLFYFDYRAEKNILLIMFDKNGNEIGRKTIEYLKLLKQQVVKLSGDKFCLVSGVKFKKAGVLIECFNQKLESQWKYEKSDEKSKFFVELSASSQDGKLALVYNEKSKQRFLLTLDASGAELANKEINEESLNKLRPYRMQFLTNEEIVMVSDFGASNDDLHKFLPLGTNVKSFNTKAEETASRNILFADVQEKLGDRKADGSLLLNAAPMLQVLDIELIDGQKSLVCESYLVTERITQQVTTPGAAPTNVNVAVMSLKDLYVINLSDFSEMKRIWKPTRTIAIHGVSSFFSVRDFCKIVLDNKMFSYQFMDNNSFFVRNINQNFEYFNKIPLSSSMDLASTRTYWGTPVKNEYQNNYKEQLFYTTVQTGVREINYNGFITTHETKLLYHLHGPTGELQFTILK